MAPKSYHMCCCHSIKEGVGYPKWSRIAPTQRLKNKIYTEIVRELMGQHLRFPGKSQWKHLRYALQCPKIKIEARKTGNHLQMHFLEMPFSLCPVLFTEKAGGISKIEEIFLSIKLVDGYKVLVEDSG